jgi:hypothetical protein
MQDMMITCNINGCSGTYPGENTFTHAIIRFSEFSLLSEIARACFMLQD